jgi:hypothetical protein
MYQHQHRPLPLEQLDHFPQPLAVLLEVLLEKDPARRFQSPNELLKAMPAVTRPIDLGRTITHQSLKMPHPDSFAVSRRSVARLGPEKMSVSRLPITGSDVFGREEDIAFLNDVWSNQQEARLCTRSCSWVSSLTTRGGSPVRMENDSGNPGPSIYLLREKF